jgi:hypothetical protein
MDDGSFRFFFGYVTQGFELSSAETTDVGVWIDWQTTVSDKLLSRTESLVRHFLQDVCARSLPPPLLDHNLCTLLYELGRQYRYKFPECSLCEYEITVEALHAGVAMIANLYKEV